MNRWRTIADLLESSLVFLGVVCAVPLFLILFGDFCEVAARANDTAEHTRAFTIISFTMVLTFIYWTFRGLAYSLKIWRKAGKDSK